jgi:hypothetical protein
LPGLGLWTAYFEPVTAALNRQPEPGLDLPQMLVELAAKIGQPALVVRQQDEIDTVLGFGHVTQRIFRDLR